MKVVHFSMTRLAGAPIRLVKALREYRSENTPGTLRIGSFGPDAVGRAAIGTNPAPEIDARLVDLEDWGHYDTDVVFSQNSAARDEAVELAENADIIHLHNYLDRDSRQFAPIDFAALERKGAFLVRHFHSIPELIAKTASTTVEAVLNCSIPSLVIAQYPERFYPRAMIVPNLVPEKDPAYMPPKGTCPDNATGNCSNCRFDNSYQPEKPAYDVVFSPTKLTSAWEDRWNTKGAPETTAMIEAASLTTGRGKVRIINDRPLADVLDAKRNARIVVDDLVNGSYHLSGLEGLCLAKPVLAWLDDRARTLLQTFSGTNTCPFINVRLEEARPVLEHLLQSENLCLEIGQMGRSWVERHWSADKHAATFNTIYKTLTQDPTKITRQPELALNTPAARFKACDMHELVFATRRDRAMGERGR